MTRKNSVPSNVALPLTALMVYVLRLVYFASEPNLMNATVVKGAIIKRTVVPMMVYGLIAALVSWAMVMAAGA
jgi:lactate permease